MWALPNIGRLNADAASASHRALIKKQLQGKKKVDCEFCDQPACPESIQEYYDIFSDDPKGVVGLCEEHESYYGSIPEGYFYCERCNRLMVENYTWENYYTHTEYGEIVCLNCAAEEYVDDPFNWIQLDEESILKISFDHISRAKHIIAVSGPIPKGIEFYRNVELDAMSGGRITGFSSSESSPDGGVQEIRDILREAKEEGYSEALLILDAAYQFAVSIGVYVRA